ncbi:hypothetical protein GQR99_01245 [Cereibacter sphaeroides]|nr:hypothetical protein GQR99_01245 [Cereibacter sphaeroides]
MKNRKPAVAVLRASLSPSCWWLVPSVIIGSSLIAWGVWALLTALGSLL